MKINNDCNNNNINDDNDIDNFRVFFFLIFKYVLIVKKSVVLFHITSSDAHKNLFHF